MFLNRPHSSYYELLELQCLDYERSRQRELGSERRGVQETKRFSSETSKRKDNKGEDEEEEDKPNDGELSTPRVNTILGLCAVCHLTLGSNSGLNQNVPCSKGHALCRRCEEQFAVRSDPGCVLCRVQLQQSNTSFSRESNASSNSIYVNSKRTQELPEKHLQYYRNCPPHVQQRLPVNAEESYVKPWVFNYTTLTSTDENELENYNIDNTQADPYYERIREQKNIEEENARYESKRQQQHSSSYYSLMKRENTEPYMSEVKVNGQITSECSRRPIRCPRIDCAINVAFSALTHHFIFDHPEVPILSVEPGTKSTLIVSFGALSSDSSRCLALLLVSGKLSDPVARLFNGSQINPKYRNRLPLPVLAARLHCTNRYVPTDDISTNVADCREKDAIIAWVAGLDVGNTTERLRCTIQAVDNIHNEGLRSLTYTGPVNSLRTAQLPRDIFSAGDCIVLHEGLLGHITSDSANLNVNVIVH